MTDQPSGLRGRAVERALAAGIPRLAFARGAACAAARLAG
jgi:hypothetical protein